MGPAADVRDVILRDGTTLRLRRPSHGESEAILAFFSGLSEQSRYLRFHGLAAVGPGLAEQFIEADGHDRGALVGSLAEDGRERIVAVAGWTRLRDPAAAEVAFAVEDRMQGKGVGTRLLEQLAADAAAAGVERFVAEVLPQNRPMLAVFADAGFETTRALVGGAVEVQLSITPTEEYRAHVDMRDHVAVVASLRPFFEPRGVAVVGASARAASIGGTIFRNLVAAGFAGPLYPVNRSGRPVAGRPAVRSLAELPEPVDLAVVAVPAEQVLDVARGALATGVRALCVISAGFAETGSEGAARQDELLATVRSYGARLLGPNCLGLAVPAIGLNATFARSSFPPGSIGFASQSGALGLALLETAEAHGLGFSSFVSVGNKADVSSNDLLEWWEDDPTTSVVLLYLESFGNPRKFARVARRVASTKPILAMKSGRTRAGARAARSHTAALAGSEAAVDALFRRAGVIRASSLEELLDVAGLYTAGGVPRGRRVAVLTNAGGLGILCADACEAAGLELPLLSPEAQARLHALLPPEASVANPVDLLGSATAESYGRALPVLLGDPAVDAVIALFVPAASTAAEDVAEALDRAAADAPDRKPVLAAFVTAGGRPRAFRSGRIAAFAYPESAARALGRAAERAEWLRRPAGTVPALEGIDRDAAAEIVERALVEEESRWLDARETRAVLLAYGVPLVPEQVAATVDEAVAAARELGLPVAVKTAAPGVHKTEVGGVALDLSTESAVRQAASRIGPPVLVQPMRHGGPELLAGLVQDPLFGPLVAFGPGGRLAELIGQASFAIAPLTDVDAEELVLGGKAGRLVRGFRGAPPADARALTDLLHRLSRLGEELPKVAELDLNPVLGLSRGCVVLDARIRVARHETARALKTW
jgi:acetyl coenzyme A synthetase (ADP forming)-like protein